MKHSLHHRDHIRLLLLPAICSIHACDDLPPLPEALLVAFWLMRVLPRCACHVPGKSHSVMCSFWYAVSTVLVWFNGLPTVSTVLCCDWFNDFSGALSFCDVCVLVRVLFWDSQCRAVLFPCRFALLLIKHSFRHYVAGYIKNLSRQFTDKPTVVKPAVVSQ